MIPNKRLPTVMGQGHTFAQVPSISRPRSVFDRSHGHKTTFDGGLLIPLMVDEVLPGDTYTGRVAAIIRLTTPLKPLMDNLYIDLHWWFVPYRLVWTNFVKFMGEQVNPGDSIAFTVPQFTLTATKYNLHTVQDYMGLNTALDANGTWSHSQLPIRAYQLIYNQWYRDENLINSVTVDLDDGPDNGLNLTPYKRGKRHDYFTSCLPFLQKGTAVSMPLGATAPVVPTSTHAIPQFWNSIANSNAGQLERSAAGAGTAVNIDAAGNSAGEGLGWNITNLQADLSLATAATINDFRTAVGIQQFLERDARGGTRYPEIILSHFGVRSDDARLQRAEYLGGGSTAFMISPIAQQTQTGLTGGSTPLGNLGGTAAAVVGGKNGFTRSFTEHGVIILIGNVRCDLTYSQGIERMWSRSTRYDFFWPVLEELSEQAVLSKEIYLDGTANDNNVFGYQERYAEYRYKPSKVTGLMKPQLATNFALWNLTEKFGSRPTLGQTFIEDQTKDILNGVSGPARVAVTTEPNFYGDFWIDLKCARPMRVFGVPGLHRM